MNEIHSKLGENFRKYFEIIYAITEEQKNEAYRLRHQVYCEELKYESLREDARETDEYDSDALHLLLRSKKSNEFVGCTRIICPRLNDPSYLFPIEIICAKELKGSRIDFKKIPRNKMAEVSRLAVIASFRKRKSDIKGEMSITNADFVSAKEQRFPYIPVSLYLGIMRLAQIKGIEYLLVLTEERLAYHFRRLGFDIRLMGNTVYHRGKRIPSMVLVSSSFNKMYPSLHSLYQIIAKDIDSCNDIDCCNQAQPIIPTTCMQAR